VDIGGVNKRAIRLSKARNEWAQRLIDQHRAAAAAGREQGKTMVGDLLEKQASDPETYSDKVIRALCLVSFILFCISYCNLKKLERRNRVISTTC
jgi:hypothetical protein